MSHPVKARLAVVVLELEGEGLFEVTSAASSLVSSAIVSMFHTSADEGDPESSDETTPPGEVKQ